MMIPLTTLIVREGAKYVGRCLEFEDIVVHAKSPHGALTSLKSELHARLVEEPRALSRKTVSVHPIEIELSHYDVARILQRLIQKEHLTAIEASNRFTEIYPRAEPFHKGYVNNLVRAVSRLAPAILAAWKRGDPNARLQDLFSLAGLAPSEQLARWKQLSSAASSASP